MHHRAAAQLQIRYTPSSLRLKQFSIFAIDDIVVRPGKCQHKHDFVYTFANGYEDLDVEFIQPVRGSIGQLVRPSFTHVAGAPTIDHTTNSADGYYFLFMNRYTFAPTTYIDTLSMMDLEPDIGGSQSCIRFAYQKVGNASVKVFIAPINSYTYYYRYAPILWTPKL